MTQMTTNLDGTAIFLIFTNKSDKIDDCYSKKRLFVLMKQARLPEVKLLLNSDRSPAIETALMVYSQSIHAKIEIITKQ